MGSFIVRVSRSRMEFEDETEQDETTSEPQEPSDRRPESKLRDLRPEKDPMGARSHRL